MHLIIIIILETKVVFFFELKSAIQIKSTNNISSSGEKNYYKIFYCKKEQFIPNLANINIYIKIEKHGTHIQI